MAAALVAYGALGGGAACSLPGSASMPGGAAERCFCAYAQYRDTDYERLDAACPSWRTWVSTDGTTPGRVRQHGAATVLGAERGNASAGRYAYVLDWAIDLGSGYGAECDTARSPRCEAVGAHVLSIPRERYLRDCCGGGPESLVALLAGAQPSPGGTVRATLRASGAAEAATPLCSLLRDMISGALPLVPQLHDYDSCRDENAEPVARNKCLAQCFHIVPDVYFLHLHTTAGVARIRTGPVDSGVGPSVNGSNARDAAAQYGRYNVCVCEPPGWAAPDGRGSCPRARPAEAAYVEQATASLCRNLAAATGADAQACEACAPREPRRELGREEESGRPSAATTTLLPVPS